MTGMFGPERRKAKFKPFRLGEPLFARVPKAVAGCILSASALVTMGASNLYHPILSVAPLYMLICAFGAWFVGCRFALCLLAYIAFFEISYGHISIDDLHDSNAYINFTIRIVAVFILVLLLGIARDALEIEWKFARVDPLTLALSRKAFFEAVAANADDESEGVLIFADVNDLKRVNDELGHEAGDAALRDFAARLRGAIRKGDLFARLGGDEFVILCKVYDRSAASILAQRIDRALNYDLEHEGVRLSCSMGVLALPNGSVAIDEELRQADKLMYLAKRQHIGAVMAVYVDQKVQHLQPINHINKYSENILENTSENILRKNFHAFEFNQKARAKIRIRSN